jgi:peptide alpha-N-acetyltransferase
VYGLLHRTDRNYGEAIKAYKQALRLDPNNQQILRDLSMLQVQMRDLDGFCRTRNALLTLRPNAKANWMAFALSKHLVGEHREAVRVIDTYLGTLSDEHSSDELGRSFESSELALYKNRILAEIPGTPGGGKNYREALEHLTACEGIVVDRTSWLLTKATYQLALQDFGGAQNTVRELFDRGMTEHYAVHTLYVSSVLEVQDWDLVREAMRLKGTRTILALLPLPDEDRARIRDTYESDLSKRYPDSYAVRTIPVTLLALSLIANATTSEATTTATGSEATAASELRNVLVQMCRKGLTKGVPSLCSELSSFVWVEKNGRYVRPDDPVDYASHPVFQLIVEVADELAACLQSESKIASSAEGEEPPSTVMWAWYLQAGLCELSGEHKKGLDLLDRCLEHTPTECEVYALKVRLLQASGGAAQAAECLDKARELDTQDRYMNNLATQYMLRAGMEDRALRTISLFAKHEGNPEQNLFDMQCSWYELEVAAHLARKQDWGRSLKKYGTPTNSLLASLAVAFLAASCIA